MFSNPGAGDCGNILATSLRRIRQHLTERLRAQAPARVARWAGYTNLLQASVHK